MTVVVDKCVLEGNDVSTATLEDDVCGATEDGDNWIISTKLDECGTAFNLDSESQIVDFSVSSYFYTGNIIYPTDVALSIMSCSPTCGVFLTS